MKFSDGFWMDRKNYDVSYASQIYESSHDSETLSLLAVKEIIYNRGMTLSGPNLEITMSSPFKDMIKVKIVHFRGENIKRPGFELNTDINFKPVITENDEQIEFISGDLKAVIKKGRIFDIQYYYKNKHMTGNGHKTLSYIKENKYSFLNRMESSSNKRFYDYTDSRNTYLREQLSLDVGEYVYGFGEKFTPFIKNGQTVDIWNSDGGTSSWQSYKSVPFYISSKSYGIFVNTPDYVSFEAASDTVSKVSFTVPGETLEYFIIGGNDPKEVISNYTMLTGRPALPPPSTFGLWLSTSFVTDYSEDTVLSFINGMITRDIPLSVFHFDCFWMKEYEWTSFEWNRTQFPEPEKLLKKIKDLGISVCVWINPYIAQRSPLFEEGMKNDFFIKNPDGSVFQCDLWQPGMAIVDFTSTDACSWFKEKIKKLCHEGVSFIKTDFGERIPVNVVYSDLSDPIMMHNYYSFLYNKTVFEALEEVYGKNNACLFSRSATAGCQRFPVHWGGDCTASYVSMAETLRGGLSLASSGFGFFSHDIGGFEENSSPDLYKRWCAFGLMSSHSRLHGNSSYRVPWLMDEEAVSVLRFFTRLKGKLMPYIYAQAVKTSNTGIPMMRPMFMEFPNDRSALTADRQYMFGDSLLCAPVFSETSEVEFYVPEGIWTDIITGKKFTGRNFYQTRCTYFEMPVLCRPNSIIIFGKFDNSFEYDYLENADICLFEPLENITTNSVITDSSGKTIFSINAVRHGNTVSVSFTPTDKNFSFTVYGNKNKYFKTSENEKFFEYTID